MPKECVTHHFACDCREARFREMEKLRELVREAIPLAKGVAFGVCLDSSDWLERAEKELGGSEPLITKEEAIELLNIPSTRSPAAKMEMIMELLDPSGDE